MNNHWKKKHRHYSFAGAAGLDVDMEEANAVVTAMTGKTVTELIAEGKKKLASVPSGGSAPAAPAAAAAAPAAAAPGW